MVNITDNLCIKQGNVGMWVIMARVRYFQLKNERNVCKVVNCKHPNVKKLMNSDELFFDFGDWKYLLRLSPLYTAGEWRVKNLNWVCTKSLSTPKVLMEFTFKSLQKLARTNAFLQRQLLALHGMDPRYFRPHQSSSNAFLRWVL